jgi:hypothetical protein
VGPSAGSVARRTAARRALFDGPRSSVLVEISGGLAWVRRVNLDRASFRRQFAGMFSAAKPDAFVGAGD